MSACARRILLNCLLRPVRCCFHRPGPMRHGPSRLHPLMTRLSFPVRNSVCSFSRRGTYPELTRAHRCRLVVVGIEVGRRLGGEAAILLRCSPGSGQPLCQPTSIWLLTRPGLRDGRHCSYASSLLDLPRKRIWCSGSESGEHASQLSQDLVADCWSELPEVAQKTLIKAGYKPSRHLKNRRAWMSP